MKTHRTQSVALAALILSTLNPQLSTLLAQGAAFTYQGSLTENGAPATGSYSLRFILYNAAIGGSQVGPTLTNEPVAVAAGLFTTTLDFGATVLDGSPRWLEVAVRTNGSASAHQALSPRQALTSAPYAFHAANAGTAMSVTGTVSSAVTFNNPANSFSGSFSGNGVGLSNVNAATLGGVAPSNFWQTGGNSGANATWYLGTADYQPLELRVNGERAVRIEPAANGWPNLIGGAPNNFVEADVSGAIVAAGVLNGIRGTSGGAAIGGGRNNLISTYAAGSVISGGQWNQLGDGSVRSVIGGGYSNQIRGFSSTNAAAVARDITDGTSNTLLLGESVGNATIGGGFGNTIGADCVAAVISGGQWNMLGDGCARGFIGGGSSNAIVDGTANTIIAGERNEINGGRYSVLAGGRGNTITGGTSSATIGGGGNNVIDSRANYTAATIAGGARNWITNSGAATIGGGSSHVIQDNGHYATIAGGVGNTIETNAGTATISGGSLNTIQSDARRSTIGGGERNTVLANARSAVIGGGLSNIVGGVFATVPGGTENSALGDYSFAAGHRARASHVGTFVWADSANADFASTTSNQFLIRASGGVGIGKTNPAAALDVNGTVAATIFQGSGLSLSNVNATTVGGLASSNFWQLGGNAGTTPGAHFIGTTDNKALEIRVNGQRALRIEPSAYPPDSVNDAPNVIGGSSVNFVAPFTVGATIGGGGVSNYFGFGPFANSVSGVFNTISGGASNTIQSGLSSTIGGGFGNTIQDLVEYALISGGANNAIKSNANQATIGGGNGNNIEAFALNSTIAGGGGNTIQRGAQHSTISGGLGNTIETNAQISTIAGGGNNLIQTNAQSATISGGSENLVQANARYATIGGGLYNTNAGQFATVAGGERNVALGNYSFAAGRAAKANHAGAFVWADSQNASFASTANNQFLVRAAGGVGIGTASPSRELEVQHAGDTEIGIRSTDANAHLWTLQSSAVSGSTNLDASFQIIDRTLGVARLLIGTNGNVGIGTSNPSERLHVIGDILASGSVCANNGVNCASDRNVKAGFEPVDTKAVLEKVAALSITRWHYTNDSTTSHLGPVAQDFHAAFQVGPDDRHIATVDADGVALAAIQGLNQKLTEELKRRDVEMEQLKRTVAELKQLIFQRTQTQSEPLESERAP